MIFKTRISRIIAASVICFCSGLFLTSAGVFTINKIEQRHAVGGFEAPVASEIDSDIQRLIVQDGAEAPQFDSVAEAVAQEITENTPQMDADVLTYQTYRVKKGDMIGFIADEFDVTQDSIISINNIKQSRLIQPGQYLKIPSIPGILYTVKTDGETPITIAQKFDVDAQKTALVNSISAETSLSAGAALFVPDAALDWMTRQEINGDLFKKPLHQRYWLSSRYGWRDSPFGTGKRTFHGGIDMAVGMGTPIYPAMDGVVSQAGYNDVYGNFVIVSHHSGYKTLYGHMSKITCKKGNFVYTNTKIGEVGSTGMSTGPHLHFTVYKNGKSMNPLSVLN